MYPSLNLGVFTISTYFLVLSLSATAGCLWFVCRAQAQRLSRVTAIDLALVCLICGFVGARLMHVLYEEPAYYIANPWRILQIWSGGFVFMGGLLSSIAGAWLFCWRFQEPFWLWADLAAAPAALTYALGRVACFLNGCCYGRVCTLPWAVTLSGQSRHPAPLYATIWEMAVLAILIHREKRIRIPGRLFALWLGLHGLGRIFMEQFRDDPRGALIDGWSVSSWISLGLVLFAAVWWSSRGKAVQIGP